MHGLLCVGPELALYVVGSILIVPILCYVGFGFLVVTITVTSSPH
jgi:hypothetical protein